MSGSHGASQDSQADGAVAEAGSEPVDPVTVQRRSNVGYYDLEGRFLYATPALAAYVGMTPDELIGRTWYEIGVPPEAVDKLEAVRRRVMETGKPATESAKFKIDGKDRETDFAFKPVVGPDGSIVGTSVTAWDAGEHGDTSRGGVRLDRTYTILHDFDQVILRTRDSHVILSEACRIAAEVGGFQLAWVGLLEPVSGDVPVIFKAGRDEGMLPSQVISVRDDPTGHGVVGTSIRENRAVVVQDVEHDGRMSAWRDFFDRLDYKTAAGFPIRLAGRPIGCLALYSSEAGHFDAAEARLYEQLAGDISASLTAIEAAREKAAAQAALEASEQRYRTLFEKNPQPVAVYDVETLHFLAVNEAAVLCYGYSRDEFLSMQVTEIIAPEDVPALRTDIASMVAGGGEYRPSGPWRELCRDGTPRFAELFTHDIDFDGRPARLVLAVDVTERRRLEGQLAEAARLEAMGNLAGGIAHDFNNLLTAVNGYADILIGELEGDERAESAREIRRAGARAAELTKQVLTFARRQAVEQRAVDLNSVVASVSVMLRRLIGEHVRLVTRSVGSPTVVMADPGQLEQVLVNLIVNSRDAMPGGGVVEIEVRRVDSAAELRPEMRGSAVLLTVADNGVGMDQVTAARAFEPFFTTKQHGLGTGLGLATVYGIVGQFGGKVWAESAPGSGTKVFVLLPAVDLVEAPIQVTPPRLAESSGGAIILVVEDDPAVRALVVATLEHAGHRVLVASTPAEAVALSDGLPDTIDVLLTDVVMPGGNGPDLAERLVSRRPELRVLLMSGYDSPFPEDRRQEGFVFLAKPFGADQLCEAVTRLLGGSPG